MSLSLSLDSAPTGPPTSVHVVPLNNSAIELQWNLPLLNLRNGRIRGFKIFFRAISSSTEEMVDVRNPRATEFIIGGLMQATYYSFSVLAYTIAEGPRSVYLTAPTYELSKYIHYLMYSSISLLLSTQFFFTAF